jgi:hypothetical protein
LRGGGGTPIDRVYAEQLSRALNFFPIDFGETAVEDLTARLFSRRSERTTQLYIINSFTSVSPGAILYLWAHRNAPRLKTRRNPLLIGTANFRDLECAEAALRKLLADQQ